MSGDTIRKLDLRKKKTVEELFEQLTTFAPDKRETFSIDEKRKMVRELLSPSE